MRRLLTAIAAATLWTSAAHAQTVTFELGNGQFTFPIAAEVTAGYDRGDWGDWQANAAGCFSTRDKVLSDESLIPVRTRPGAGGRCIVISGRWVGPFTGQVFVDSGDIQIDHLVPLAEAHRSGAHAWTREQREAYFNELSYVHHLIAVHGAENGSKSDDDPDDYLPPRFEFRCKYVEAWIRVKAAWELNMDQDEANAVADVLAGCGDLTAD